MMTTIRVERGNGHDFETHFAGFRKFWHYCADHPVEHELCSTEDGTGRSLGRQ